MTNINEQSQFELFPGASQQTPGSRHLPTLLRDLTISLENIIVLCIIFIMSVVLFFSLGVERGKRISLLSNPTDANAFTVQPQVPNVNTPLEPKDITITPSQQAVIKVMPEAQTQEIIPLPKDIKEAIEKQYTIQVASFKQEKFANQEATNLKQKGFDSFVVSKGNHIIVCVGKFDAFDQAKKFLSNLKNKYKDCLVRRL